MSADVLLSVQNGEHLTQLRRSGHPDDVATMLRRMIMQLADQMPSAGMDQLADAVQKVDLP